ncbi:MAG: hypothetical protein K5871_11460 [Lachnospiraceae bacterium]|nr:hypothetical protein [Lachnospiraceae bacterium]
MGKSAKENKKKGSGIFKGPEFLRKFIVSLKRRPQNIPFLIFIIAFCVYSLGLTNVSNTTARILGRNMGLYGFITMLFSILLIVCFMNSFPRRKKPNYPMLILMFAMTAVVFFCDFKYREIVKTALTRSENPVKLEVYIAKAYNMLYTHEILLIIASVLTLLIPVYKKLLNMIPTGVVIEGNDQMGEIELSDDQ